MKLKKLLPITAMAGVAAVAAPLVTSCAEKGTMIKWTIDDGEENLPTPKSAGALEFDDEEAALNAYLTDISKDKTIFSKDAICSIYASDYIADPDATFANVNLIEVRTDGVDVEKHTISYLVHTQIKTTPNYGSMKWDITYEAKNIEFGLYEFPITADITIKYLEPTLLYYYELSEYDERYYYDELIELSNDSTWSYSIDFESSLGTKVHEVVDHSNVLDPMNDIIEQLFIPVYPNNIGSYVASTYFGEVSIG